MSSRQVELLGALVGGETFLLHRRLEAPRSTRFWVSDDLTKLVWRDVDQGHVFELPIKQVKRVLTGVSTTILRLSGEAEKAQLYLSLATADAALNLEAKSEAVRDKWAKAFKAMLKGVKGGTISRATVEKLKAKASTDNLFAGEAQPATPPPAEKKTAVAAASAQEDNSKDNTKGEDKGEDTEATAAASDGETKEQETETEVEKVEKVEKVENLEEEEDASAGTVEDGLVASPARKKRSSKGTKSKRAGGSSSSSSKGKRSSKQGGSKSSSPVKDAEGGTKKRRSKKSSSTKRSAAAATVADGDDNGNDNDDGNGDKKKTVGKNDDGEKGPSPDLDFSEASVSDAEDDEEAGTAAALLRKYFKKPDGE